MKSFSTLIDYIDIVMQSDVLLEQSSHMHGSPGSTSGLELCQNNAIAGVFAYFDS